MFMLQYLLFLQLCTLCYTYPTIIMHGIASNKHQLEEFSEELSNEINTSDSKIYNMEIERGEWTSIFMNLNDQCRIFSNNINYLNITEEKINIIGFSQGGLIARCYVEKYSHKIKSVNTLITIASPNMGIFISNISPLSNIINPIKEYWKNPFKYNNYLETNDFLVYINNEKHHKDYLNYKKFGNTEELKKHRRETIQEPISLTQSKKLLSERNATNNMGNVNRVFELLKRDEEIEDANKKSWANMRLLNN